MSTLTTSVDRSLAQLCRVTGRFKAERLLARVGATPLAGAVDFLARGAFHWWRNRRYLTVLKVLNIALVNAQFHLKTERVIGRPYKMKIESTNICNTKCQLCPTGLGRKGRDKGKMAFEPFAALIDRFRRHLVALDLSMWGDPLIVPDIYRMIRYAHDRGVWTYLSSNLHAFKLQPKPGQKDQAEALVESGLDLMTCSLHGASQATYEAYQPGKSFDEAVAKIRHIIATRDRMGSATPQVQLNFVVMRQNEHEREAFQRLADELGCRAVFSTASINTRFIAEKDDNRSAAVTLGLGDDLKARLSPEQQTRMVLEKWLPKDKDYRLAPYDQMLQGEYRSERYNGHKPFFCDWLWRQAVINWDGQVSTCCGSFDPGEDMGSVLDKPFEKIWNGPKYRMARRSFRKPLTDEQAQGNGCATCPGFMV